MADVMDSKSIGSNTVPVQVRPPAPSLKNPHQFSDGKGMRIVYFPDKFACKRLLYSLGKFFSFSSVFKE
jgi:hypothetical protein